jgi:hypothetical protein
MSLVTILIASVSVVFAVLALFFTAAILSVNRARRNYERAASNTELPERANPVERETTHRAA